MMLTEEVEFPPTPQLPISRILEDESGKAAWLMPLSKAKKCFLWKISALTGPCDPESFYTAALTPPIVPWKPVQVGLCCPCSDMCICALVLDICPVFLLFPCLECKPVIPSLCSLSARDLFSLVLHSQV